MKIILISCCKTKLPYRAKARDLYISPLFTLSLKYALSLKPDAIYILSAKYGLVPIDQEVETYDLALKNMNEHQKKAWAQKVVAALQQKTDIENDHFIVLAGDDYREHILPYLHSYEVPLKGLPFGGQLQELKRRVHG